MTSSIDRGTYQEPNKITLAAYAKEYLAHYAVNLSNYTQEAYRRTLDNHILPALGEIKLTKPTHREVQAFVASLGTGGKGLSAKTVRNIHGVLHSILEAAVRDEILIRNVSDQCILPCVTQAQIKAITTAELANFLNAIEKEPFRNIFFVDIFTGLRQAEILGLCWHDIDWENGCIYIRNQLQQRQVRGDFSYSPRQRRAKNAGSFLQTAQCRCFGNKNPCRSICARLPSLYGTTYGILSLPTILASRSAAARFINI